MGSCTLAGPCRSHYASRQCRKLCCSHLHAASHADRVPCHMAQYKVFQPRRQMCQLHAPPGNSMHTPAITRICGHSQAYLKLRSMMESKAGILALRQGTISPHMPSSAAAAMERSTVDFPAGRWRGRPVLPHITRSSTAQPPGAKDLSGWSRRPCMCKHLWGCHTNSTRLLANDPKKGLHALHEGAQPMFPQAMIRLCTSVPGCAHGGA